jgi:tetrahydromethanopterin S-methyltransferase subunit D
MSCEGLLVVHAVSTFAMVGLIWFVQVVHYPMLARHAGEGFGEVEREHCNRTGFVAAPLMLVEVMTAALLMIGGFNPPLFLLAVILLIGAWISTFLLQVPCHKALLSGWNEEVHRRLVATNWIRTIIWTLRSFIMAFILV